MSVPEHSLPQLWSYGGTEASSHVPCIPALVAHFLHCQVHLCLFHLSGSGKWANLVLWNLNIYEDLQIKNYENLRCGSGDRKATWTIGWWSFEVPPVFHSENPLWFTFISSGTLADLTAESIRSVILSYRSCSKEYQLQWSHLFHHLTMFGKYTYLDEWPFL